MDCELKNIIFKYILKFEKILKSHLSYQFANMYVEEYSYLQMKNYSQLDKDLDLVLKNLSILSNILNKERKSKNKGSIKHYVDKYSSIPIWVLINSLTLGNVLYFYRATTDKLKNNVAKQFSLSYKLDYNINIKITSEMIIDLLKLSMFFRNIAAHDEIMFSFHLIKTGKIKSFNKYLNNNYTGKTFYDLILALKLVIPKDEYILLLNDIEIIFNRYKNAFKVKGLYEIIKIAGFNENWQTILNI